MRFARNVFLIAGIYGVLVLGPMYFTEGQVGRDYPPPITHAENFYGFVGVGLAWQFAFLVMSRDPARYRLLIPAAVFEKFSFGIATIVLFLQNRLAGLVLGFGMIDLILGSLFAAAFWTTRSPETS